MLVTIWGRNATQSTFNNLTTAGQVKLVCITQTTFKIYISQRLIHWKILVMAASIHACKRCAAEVILVDWCALWNILGTLLYMWQKKGKETCGTQHYLHFGSDWPVFLNIFCQICCFHLGGGEEPPSMKLTKIALSCFAHFYIYSSANTTQNQFTYFDGLPLKQVFCINSIVHSSCESTFHVWQYSFWWWSECFTIKLNHFLGQSLSQT